MILINKILYDEESGEADVELISNNVCLRCYCHPVKNNIEIYESVRHHLLAFQVSNIMIDETAIAEVDKTNLGYYSYFLRGEVISNTKIQIHDFIIDIGVLPKDIKVGDYISCNCLRLDMII